MADCNRNHRPDSLDRDRAERRGGAFGHGERVCECAAQSPRKLRDRIADLLPERLRAARHAGGDRLRRGALVLARTS
ncbi:MAG: hypothetical protein ACK56F_23315, partial [bacterium]